LLAIHQHLAYEFQTAYSSSASWFPITTEVTKEYSQCRIIFRFYIAYGLFFLLSLPQRTSTIIRYSEIQGIVMCPYLP
jgi:hypothetical protein